MDAYDDFFMMHYVQDCADQGGLIRFAVRFYRLIVFSDDLLNELAQCPPRGGEGQIRKDEEGE